MTSETRYAMAARTTAPTVEPRTKAHIRGARLRASAENSPQDAAENARMRFFERPRLDVDAEDRRAGDGRQGVVRRDQPGQVRVHPQDDGDPVEAGKRTPGPGPSTVWSPSIGENAEEDAERVRRRRCGEECRGCGEAARATTGYGGNQPSTRSLEMDESGGQRFDGAAAFDDQSRLPVSSPIRVSRRPAGLAFHETEPAARAARERQTAIRSHRRPKGWPTTGRRPQRETSSPRRDGSVARRRKAGRRRRSIRRFAGRRRPDRRSGPCRRSPSWSGPEARRGARAARDAGAGRRSLRARDPRGSSVPDRAVSPQPAKTRRRGADRPADIQVVARAAAAPRQDPARA